MPKTPKSLPPFHRAASSPLNSLAVATMSCLRMRRTQFASQVSPFALAAQTPPRCASLYPATSAPRRVPLPTMLWQTACSPQRCFTSLWGYCTFFWTVQLAAMANNDRIAVEELPHPHTNFYIDSAGGTHIRHRESASERGLRIHLAEVPGHRPRIRCHCGWSRRSRAARGLWSGGSWLQHGLHIQAVSHTITYGSGAGRHQRCSWKVRNCVLTVGSRVLTEPQHA